MGLLRAPLEGFLAVPRTKRLLNYHSRCDAVIARAINPGGVFVGASSRLHAHVSVFPTLLEGASCVLIPPTHARRRCC